MEGKIKQIIPLPADTTVLCECHASEKDWYYPYLYDAVELGGFPVVALVEDKYGTDLTVLVASCDDEPCEGHIVPTVHCKTCGAKMVAHVREFTDLQAALHHEYCSPFAKGGIEYRCPMCDGKAEWHLPFEDTYDDKARVDRETEEE